MQVPRSLHTYQKTSNIINSSQSLDFSFTVGTCKTAKNKWDSFYSEHFYNFFTGFDCSEILF